MTRLYAGWAPGEALNFGWQLGVTASHSDELDYRAMLARFRVGGLPAANVRYELLNDEPLRALDERYQTAKKDGCYEWLISKGPDGREYA